GELVLLVQVDEGEGDDLGDAVLEGDGSHVAGARPALDGLVAATSEEAIGRPPDHRRDLVAVVGAAALVLWFELAAGVGRQQLVVRPRGEETEAVRLEQEPRDGAFVEAVGCGQLEVRLVLALEDGDVALAGAGDPPLPRRVRRHARTRPGPR